MTCRSCSAEIDAKAIVCYRCGAPTADSATRRPAPAGRRSWGWVIVVVVIALAVATYWLAFRPVTPG